MVGSSWNQLEISGVAPIMSPAWTRMVRPRTVAASRWVLSHAAPPMPGRGGLQVAVEVVHPQQPDLHAAARVRGFLRWRRLRVRIQTEQGDEDRGDERSRARQEACHCQGR